MEAVIKNRWGYAEKAQEPSWAWWCIWKKPFIQNKGGTIWATKQVAVILYHSPKTKIKILGPRKFLGENGTKVVDKVVQK